MPQQAAAAAAALRSSTTTTSPGSPYVGVTGMKVGGAKLIDMDASSGHGGVLVSSRSPP